MRRNDPPAREKERLALNGGKKSERGNFLLQIWRFRRNIIRLQNFGFRSGEFCVCKLIAYSCAGKIGTIHT